MSLHFPPSPLATKMFSGLRGLEMGGSEHNQFLLNTLNVDWTDDLDTSWKQEEIRHNGTSMKVDIVADGTNLPFKDGVFDFVVSSHCLEHNWDIISALREWRRVIKVGGHVFTIFPHPDRTFDKGRPRTKLSELVDRASGKLSKPSLDGVAAIPENYHLFHFTVWYPEDAVECVNHIGGCEMVSVQDQDDKVGNGFAFVFRKSCP